MPVKYYTYPKNSLPFTIACSIKQMVLEKAVGKAVTSADLVRRIKGACSRWGNEVPAHTIRARISELVASGDLIRLIDARDAHREAWLQGERELRRIRKACQR